MRRAHVTRNAVFNLRQEAARKVFANLQSVNDDFFPALVEGLYERWTKTLKRKASCPPYTPGAEFVSLFFFGLLYF